jgi:putative hydrolases of HD superfamily
VSDRLQRQMAFVMELDRLKGILRRSLALAGQRPENSAEHSWHLALMVVLLSEYADHAFNVAHAIKMALVHDVVEIDAGDTFCYDDQACLDKDEREQRAADRLFAVLPPEQGAELRALWEEFEAAATPESRFANAMDRLQPLLLNYYSQGQSWREHGVTRERIIERCCVIGDGSQQLWAYAKEMIDQAVTNGYVPG